MAKDATTVAQKWVQNLSSATQAITDGVNGVQVPPGQAAAQQKTAWVQGVTNSQNKWARNVAAVPLSEWQQATINKGVPRIATGAAAAQPKMQTFMSKLLPYIESGRNSLPARGDFNANVNRMVAFANYMHKFSNS